MTCTIFKDIFDKTPNYITIDQALARIKTGRSKDKVMEIRNALDKEKANDLKKQLPSVCFSGKFSERKDGKIIQHSGFLVLDFDNVVDLEVKAAELANKPFVYALWVSPSGNGLKALIRIADGSKHREHFNRLKELMPDADGSGVNESRVCYESYDPTIYINKQAAAFTETVVFTKHETTEAITDDNLVFKNLLKWQVNKGGAFASGQRNIFIYKLAGALCRYGVNENSAVGLILSEFPASNDFTTKEAGNTIKSAYRSNAGKFATAAFERDVLVDKATRKEVDVQAQEFDPNEPTRDVIYGATVKNNAIELYNSGYASVTGIGVPMIDDLFKAKKGEITCLTGIGNYGKSTWYKWYVLVRVLLFGEKFASFSPEDNPPEEYYHDFVEMLLGCDCTPSNPTRPSVAIYSNAYDFVSRHIFYLYPKDTAPTPQYVMERFLELIIKEKVSGVCIDPHNQMVHDYGGRTDKYLEQVFGQYSRFAQENSVYFIIVAHPRQMKKDGTGNYECPDVFDLADGAMWNNKMDNILVYHRPFRTTDPSNPTCDFYSKKIKRQKTVGKIGMASIEYKYRFRRFEIDGCDPIYEAIQRNKLDFNKPIIDFKPVPISATPLVIDNPYAGFQRSPLPPEKSETYEDAPF